MLALQCLNPFVGLPDDAPDPLERRIGRSEITAFQGLEPFLITRHPMPAAQVALFPDQIGFRTRRQIKAGANIPFESHGEVIMNRATLLPFRHRNVGFHHQRQDIRGKGMKPFLGHGSGGVFSLNVRVRKPMQFRP